jgi:DNA primase
MPYLDYAALRARISIHTVLQQCNYAPLLIRGDQWRGACPLHGSQSPRDHCFSVNLRRNVFHCFRCHAKGNQLDLWARFTKLPLYDASLDLCARLGIEPPRFPSSRNSKTGPS